VEDAAAPPPPAPPAPPPLSAEPTPNELRSAIKAGRAPEVVAVLSKLPPVERAELFLRLRLPEQKAILAAAPPELAAAILADCDSASLEPILAAIDPASLAPALALVPPDNLADIVLRLPPELRDRVLGLCDVPHREDVRKLMTFDPESAGGLMTTRYLSVPDVVTIGHAIELLRAEKRADTPSYIYIVDVNGRLAGVAPLRKLILGNARAPIRSIMVSSVTRVPSGAPKEELVDLFRTHHFASLPVVDAQDRLVGIVTSDDVMKAIRRGEEEVLQGVTGVDPRERLKETFHATRGRLPWIAVTIAGGLGCAVIGGVFQKTLEQMVVLGVFVPLVLALGESIGAQTTSVVLSTLAGRPLSRAELVAFGVKEFIVGVLVALISGVAVASASVLWHGNPRLGVLIGAAIFISVAWAALLAVCIPGAMKRLNVNPAIASGPLVLALADLSTLLVYYGGATLFRDRVL
jgi:magnesium transporter